MPRKREREPLGPAELSALVRETLAALARGRAPSGETCATCGRAEGCNLLAGALAKVAAQASRARVAGGRCDRWAPRMAGHVQPQGLEQARPAE